MSTTIASWIWTIIGIYLVLGILFAVLFLFIRLEKSDPAAAGSTKGFKAIILPGVILMWPTLLKRWIKGINEPPEEKSPHRNHNPI